MTQHILTGVLVLAILAAAFLGGYYIWSLRRMQRLIHDYQEKGRGDFQTMKETRESKLENQLLRLLDSASKKRSPGAERKG